MNDWDDAFDRILRVYCTFVPEGEPIDPDAPLATLGVDSLSTLGLIVDSEEAFDVEVPPNLLTDEVLATPGTFWSALQGLVDEKYRSRR